MANFEHSQLANSQLPPVYKESEDKSNNNQALTKFMNMSNGTSQENSVTSSGSSMRAENTLGVGQFSYGINSSGEENNNSFESRNDSSKEKRQNAKYSGIYSSTGFDLLEILSKLHRRENPQIEMGPVDLSSTFVVADAQKFDFPIVYASTSFEQLTGYTATEVIGKNCRFLQSPDGHVTLGSRRRFTDSQIIYNIKSHMVQGKEFQTSLINYRKNGQPFVNLVTIIPIFIDDNIAYFVGLQVDLIDQPNSILERMRDGTYTLNYNMIRVPQYISSGMDDFYPNASYSMGHLNAGDIYESIVGKPRSKESHRRWNQLLVEQVQDFIHVLSLKGVFLYASTSCETILGYTPQEIEGNTIAQLYHPNDMVPILRELKEFADETATVNYIGRIKNKQGDYLWMESMGQLIKEKNKARKAVLISGRIRPAYQLSIESLQLSGGLSRNEFWCKLTLDGLILYCTSNSKDLIDCDSNDLIGSSFYSLLCSEHAIALTRALQQAKEGITVRLRCKYNRPIFRMENQCHYERQQEQQSNKQKIELHSTFYPGSKQHNKTAFIMCQTKCKSKEQTCEKKVINDDNLYKAEEREESETISSVPSPLANNSSIISKQDNFFPELNVHKKSSWQYELHQLRLKNQKIKNQIQSICKFREQRNC